MTETAVYAPSVDPQDVARFSNVDLTRQFKPYDQRIPQPSREEITAILAKMGKLKPEDELNCGACGYDSCVQHATAIHRRLEIGRAHV